MPEPSATQAPARAKDQLRVIRPGLSGALTRYRIMAFVTGVVLAYMTVVGLVLFKWILHDPPGWYSLGWMAHGWLYIVYVGVGLDLVFRMKWSLWKALLILIAGTIPFMSFVAERWVTKQVHPLLEQD